jgi:hypothetical protein
MTPLKTLSRFVVGLGKSWSVPDDYRKIIAFLVVLASTVWASSPGHAEPIPTHGLATHFDLLAPGVDPGPGHLVPSTIGPIGTGMVPPAFFAPAAGTPFPAFDEPPPPLGRGPHTGCAEGLAFFIAPPGLNVGGLACSFGDALDSSPDPWHWETKISSPDGADFFVGWFVGGQPIAAGILAMAPGSVFYMDIDFAEATFGLPETKTPPFGAFNPPYFMAFHNGSGATLGFDGSVTEGVGAPPSAIFVPPGPIIDGISSITGLPVTAGFAIDPPFIDSFVLDPSVVRFLLPGLAAGIELQVVAMIRVPEPSGVFLLGLGLVGLIIGRRGQVVSRLMWKSAERIFRLVSNTLLTRPT